MYRLRTTSDTTFKQSTIQASQLAPDQLAQIKAGQEYPIVAWAPDRHNHIRFTLGRDDKGQQMTIFGRNTWFAFAPHVALTKGDRPINPQATTTRKTEGHYRLKLTSARSRDEFGCMQFWLAVEQDKRPIGTKILTISGAPGTNVIYPTDDYSGSNAPIYEGYFLLGPVERGWWGSAIGGIWISIDPFPQFKDTNSRSAIGYHEDANRSWRPGSAGCICPLNTADTEYMAAMVDRLNIKELVVDHGQGWLAKHGLPA